MKSGTLDFVTHDKVCLAQGKQTLSGNFTHDAHGQPRAGKGVSFDDNWGEAEFTPYGAHFVFKKVAQWLDEG